MINKVIFKKIKFHNIHTKNFDKYILKKGLFVFPAAPGLASLSQSKKYHESLRKADLVFFDSGFFVLLLKIFKNISVRKFSGYKFLNLFFDFLKKNKKKSVFCVDPNSSNTVLHCSLYVLIHVSRSRLHIQIHFSFLLKIVCVCAEIMTVI